MFEVKSMKVNTDFMVSHATAGIRVGTGNSKIKLVALIKIFAWKISQFEVDYGRITCSVSY